MKTAVVYYSNTGNVKGAAEKIAEAIKAELIPLEPVKPLKGAGFFSIMKGGGQVALGKKPPLKEIPDLSGYERIVLGTPVWAGKCAAPVWTFLASGALKEKSVAFFTFSGSGEDEKAAQQVRAASKEVTASVALVDARVPASSGNETKLAAFLQKLAD